MYEKIINIFKVILAFALMVILGFISLVLRVVSLGYLIDFNRKYIVAFGCRFILFCLGINIINKLPNLWNNSPCFFTFNHNSYLDGFVLMSIGLTRTRVLMSEKMLIYIPATLISMGIGVLFIPQKKYAARRLAFFKRLENRLLNEKCSFIGSSEGVHKYTNEINEFNRGVYHTALLCKLPVYALYIYTPQDSNPMANFKPFKKGTIVLELVDFLSTSEWHLETLDEHIESVRLSYIRKDKELKSRYGNSFKISV